MLRVSGLAMGLGFTGDGLRRAAAKKLRLPEEAVGEVRLVKKSVDARKKGQVHFVCTAEVQVENEGRVLARCRDNGVQKAVPYCYEMPARAPLAQRPVVVGLGPAGRRSTMGWLLGRISLWRCPMGRRSLTTICCCRPVPAA